MIDDTTALSYWLNWRLLVVLLADFVINGAGKKIYTEWTFTLVTVYFGLASSLSIIGYLRYCHEVEPESTTDNADRGSYVPPILGEGTDTALETGSLNCYCEPKFGTVALVWGYALQIIFQMSAGVVALNDSVFWLILYPSTYAGYYGLSFYNYEVEYLQARREAGHGKGLVNHDIVDMSELYTDIMGRSSKEGLPWASSADFDTMCSTTEPSDYVRAIDSKSKQDYQLVEAM
ncbi:hypothetical protein ACS0TY_006640 [Phlomoides rotata]